MFADEVLDLFPKYKSNIKFNLPEYCAPELKYVICELVRFKRKIKIFEHLCSIFQQHNLFDRTRKEFVNSLPKVVVFLIALGKKAENLEFSPGSPVSWRTEN